MSFWDFIVYLFWFYVFFAYLMVLFKIIVDIFRDHTLNGWLKAVWLIFLLFVPILAALVYLIARGRGMTERSLADMQAARSETDQYIRSVASSSPAEEIAKAKTLLDTGAINQTEFNNLKNRAMGVTV
ncbi:PLDc N-terminal domain-containing protein [Mycetocola sp. 2940]|uniref:PLDc N-terminal domain-containing protein n=1 Tax=Mycetocola sp. 2940 TaxID=3156452 RepID=UPI0033951876